MDEKYCNERHSRVNEEFKRLFSTCENHESRIGILERSDTKMTEKLENLIKQLGALAKAVMSLVALLISTLVGFFVWAIQNNLFK